MSINLQESLAAGKQRRAAMRQAAEEAAAMEQAIIKEAFYQECPDLFDPADPPTIERDDDGFFYVAIQYPGLAPFYLVWMGGWVGWTTSLKAERMTRDPVSIADMLAERSEAYEASVTEVPF